jgi:hypothetical protein
MQLDKQDRNRELSEREELQRQYAWEMEQTRKEEEQKRLERKRELQEVLSSLISFSLFFS